MDIKKVYAVYFSPCGSTEKISLFVADTIASTLDVPAERVDFTMPSSRETFLHFKKDDLVVFATPTYAGRIPNKIMPFVRDNITADNTPMINIATFGNRSFDDCLMEQKILLEKNGFISVGGLASVNRHVFSKKIAPDRPSKDDMEDTKNFATKIADFLLKNPLGNIYVEFDGDEHLTSYYTPLGENLKKANFLKATPKTDMDKCTDCKICAMSCPMGSISFGDVDKIIGICIKCQACVIKCPENAKFFDDGDFLSHVKMLENCHTSYVDNKYFYPMIKN